MKAQQFSFSTASSEATYMYVSSLIAEKVYLCLMTILFTLKELSIKKLFLIDSTTFFYILTLFSFFPFHWSSTANFEYPICSSVSCFFLKLVYRCKQ